MPQIKRTIVVTATSEAAYQHALHHMAEIVDSGAGAFVFGDDSGNVSVTVEDILPPSTPKQFRNPSEIVTEADVRSWFQHLLQVENVNFHPDDNFHDITSYETNARTYTDDEADLRNDLMGKCYDILGEDIYRVGMDEMDRLSATSN